MTLACFSVFLWTVGKNVFSLSEKADGEFSHCKSWFLLKNFDLKLALGQTDHISFIPSLFFSLNNLMSFTSSYVNTWFVFLLAQLPCQCQRHYVFTTKATMNQSNLSLPTLLFKFLFSDSVDVWSIDPWVFRTKKDIVNCAWRPGALKTGQSIQTIQCPIDQNQSHATGLLAFHPCCKLLELRTTKEEQCLWCRPAVLNRL